MFFKNKIKNKPKHSAGGLGTGSHAWWGLSVCFRAAATWHCSRTQRAGRRMQATKAYLLSTPRGRRICHIHGWEVRLSWQVDFSHALAARASASCRLGLMWSPPRLGRRLLGREEDENTARLARPVAAVGAKPVGVRVDTVSRLQPVGDTAERGAAQGRRKVNKTLLAAVGHRPRPAPRCPAISASRTRPEFG